MNKTIQHNDKNRSCVAYINLRIYTSSAVKWLMSSIRLDKESKSRSFDREVNVQPTAPSRWLLTMNVINEVKKWNNC